MAALRSSLDLLTLISILAHSPEQSVLIYLRHNLQHVAVLSRVLTERSEGERERQKGSSWTKERTSARA